MNIILKNRRTMVESLKNDDFKKAVEVGVRTGWYSKYILDHTNMTVDCVDPWEPNKELGDHKAASEAYDFCKNLLSPYADRCKLVKAYSPEVADLYEDNSLDFVYIDGLHDYESVKKDMNAWYKKVKPKKILSGHDFNTHKWPGVVQAVEEFCKENNLKCHLTGMVWNAFQSRNGDIDEWDGDEHSWVIIKE